MLKKICHFHVDGFRSMVVGRNLWKIVLIKVAVLLVLALVLPDSTTPPSIRRNTLCRAA